MSEWTRLRVLGIWLLAVPLVYACFFAHLDALGLVGPDEPRYAAVARGMAATGDWVTPRLHGRPWFEKPVLYYWTAAAAFRLLGVNEFAARLPSALAATLVLLALACAAWRLYGAGASCAVLLLFPTSVGIFGFARAATTDMLFAAFLTLAMLAAGHLFWNAPTSSVRAALGLALGLATLAKGPAAVVLAAGGVALWAVVARRWRDALRPAHPVVLVFFLLTAVPWYALCAARHPEFVDEFLLAHNLARFFTPVFQHVQPWWFFGPILLLGLVPWTLLLGGAARDAARCVAERRLRESPGVFFACWAAFIVVFFSVSQSKLPGYALPALPPLVLLMAAGFARAASEGRALARWLAAGAGLTFVGLALSSPFWLRKLPQETGWAEPSRVLVAATAVGVFGLLVALLALRRRPWAALVLAALLLAGLLENIQTHAIPELDAHLSPRTAATAVEPAGEALRVFRLHRAWRYGVEFYLAREPAEWEPASREEAFVLTSAAGLDELARADRSYDVLAEVSRQAVLVRVFAPGR